jgi:acetyl-CoA acetyltransferase
MRPVYIAGFAELPHLTRDNLLDEPEMVQRVTAMALADAGLTRDDVGFTCSGSNDYVMGRPFSFATALDGLGAWPPIRESHVEMDGAWALYEAYVRLQHGDVDVALVYGFGKSSLGSVDKVRTLELDPYTLAPLDIDPLSLAAMQARLLIHQGLLTEEAMAATVQRSRTDGNKNPVAPDTEALSTTHALTLPQVRPPLRAQDAAIRTDGAAAIVLSTEPIGPRIAGIAHCIDSHQPGGRDLTMSPSTSAAAEAAGGTDGVEVAELHVEYSHQEAVLVRALGWTADTAPTLSPSGGAMAANTPMVSGLCRIGYAARAVNDGAARALGHATSGPLLQHNLICIVERL